MDSRIVPTERLGSAILAALQAQQGDAQVQALLAFVGESLDLVLLTKEGGTARLQMPNGQVIEAKGDLPYPTGTRLTVQVLPPGADQTAPRLKLVEAVPPASLPILAPLQQGEALQLLARLTVPETPPELAALARLFAALGAGGRETASEKPGSGRADVAKEPSTRPDQGRVEGAKPAPPQAAPPSTERIVATLKELPPAVLRDLQRILFPAASKPPSLEEMAGTLRLVLQTLEAGGPAPGSGRSPASAAQPGRGGPGLDSLALPAAFPKAPVSSARSNASPAAAAQELLQKFRQPPLGTVPASPAGTADPALEPLKDFLLLLLKPIQQDSPSGPGPRARVDTPPSAAGPAEAEPPAAPEAGLPAAPPAPDPALPLKEAAPVEAAAVQRAAPTGQPSSAAIVTILEELPPAVLQDLQRILFPAAAKAPSLQETAETLRLLLEAMPLPLLTPTAAPGDADPALLPLKNLLQFLLQPSGESAGLALADLLARAGAKAIGSESTATGNAATGLPGSAHAAAGRPGTPAPPAGQGDAAAKAAVAPAAIEPAANPPGGTPAQLPAEAALRSAEPPAMQTALPSTGRIVAMLRAVPPALLLDFQRILFPGASKPPSLPEMAEVLRGILQAIKETPQLKGGNPVGDVPAAPTGSPSRFQTPAIPQAPSGADPVQFTESRPAISKDFPLAAGQGKAGVATPVSSKNLPVAGAGRPETGSAGTSAEILQRVQQSLALPAQPLPLMLFQGGGDPALEPLKNLLMFLLRPSFAGESAGPALAELLARAASQPPPETPAATRPGAGPPSPPEPGPVLESGPKPQATNVRHGEVPKAIQTAPNPSPHAADRAPAPARAQDPAASLRPVAAEPPALAAKSWESWLSEGVRTLSDPQSSPREAPFHLAQAREGTAFFELPLPWEGQGKVLQMWVESDPERESRGGGENTRRVLVGLHFSALGETRVGIVQAGDRLQVRVWAEHPEVLRSREDAIRSSLADLGPELDFQVLPLGEPGEVIPSLRALAAGTGFHALG